MVKIEKDYAFDGPNDKPSLKDLFGGRRQLIVYHLIFDPTWDKGAQAARVSWMPWAICCSFGENTCRTG